MAEQGTIQVWRPPGIWVDIARRYRIRVDGQQIGRIGIGGNTWSHVEAGGHVVQARVDWTGSERVHIDVAPGETVQLSVIYRGNIFSRTRYLWLVPEARLPNRRERRRAWLMIGMSPVLSVAAFVGVHALLAAA